MEKETASGARLRVLNRDVIKYIAMFTMLLNHTACTFLTPGTPLYEIFEDIGFFTAPLMCFFLVEGYDYTRSKVKYGQRLLLFAVISQIPYTLAFHFGNLNMLYTLFCCFLILVVLDKVQNPMVRPALCLLLVYVTAVGDWGVLAAVYTILFYHSRSDRKRTACSFGIAYVLFTMLNLLSRTFTAGSLTFREVIHALPAGTGIIAAGVAVLVFYNGKRAERGRNFAKWFFYIFYPAHLLILYLIKMYLGSMGVD